LAKESHDLAKAAWVDNGREIDEKYYRKEIRSLTRDLR